MNHRSKMLTSGFSTDISAILKLHGRQFAVSSLGPTSVTLREPALVEAGRGIIVIMIESKSTIYHLDLLNGIDPNIGDQPYRLIEETAESAA